eukprot:COSAG01_NODE_1132_length_11565_cov_84.210412_2_plen_247_part_00
MQSTWKKTRTHSARKSAYGAVPAHRRLAVQDNRKGPPADETDLGCLFGSSDEEAVVYSPQAIIEATSPAKRGAAPHLLPNNLEDKVASLEAELKSDQDSHQRNTKEFQSQLDRISTDLLKTRENLITAKQVANKNKEAAAAAANLSAAAVAAERVTFDKHQKLEIDLNATRDSLEASQQTVRDEHKRCLELEEKLADANESWQREVLLQLKTQEDFDWANGTSELIRRIYRIPPHDPPHKRQRLGL